MVPTEFEKELKKRLRSREATPAEDTWDRIAARLEAEGPSPRPKPRWWVGLAAASIALLASLLFFWDRPDPLPVLDPVVEAPAEPVPGPEGHQGVPSTSLPADTGQVGMESATLAAPSEIAEAVQASPPVADHAKKTEKEAVSTEKMAPSEGMGRVDLPVNRLPETTPDRGVATPGENGSVRDARIDSLLLQAQEAIAARDTTEAAPYADASALLAQAEEELDQTFREQMVQKLREGYNRMRQAVAARKQ